MEQVILQQIQQFQGSPPTLDLVQQLILADNVLSLVAVVCYALEAQNKFHGFEYGYRFGFDEIIEYLGINHGIIPLSTDYYFLFDVLIKGSPEIFDFFRILRSKKDWTATTFLFQYLHSDLHSFTHKVTTTFSSLPIPEQHNLIRSRSFELAFTHGQDKLWYWLSPCDIPSRKITDIITLLDFSIQDYNDTIEDTYITLIQIATSTFNFNLLYTLFVRQCPRLIYDDKTIDIDQEIRPYRFSFAYDYSDATISSTIKSELHGEKVGTKGDGFDEENGKSNLTNPIAPVFDQDKDIASASLLEPYIPDLTIIRSISLTTPITSYWHCFRYHDKMAQLQNFINEPTLALLKLIDDAEYNNTPEFGEKHQISEDKYLVDKLTQAQAEFNFLTRYIQQQRSFFNSILTTFGWYIWPSQVYPYMIIVAQCYKDETMLMMLDQIGLNEQTMFTFYTHAHTQVPSTTYQYKDLFCTILSSGALVDNDQNEQNLDDIDSAAPVSDITKCIPYKIAHEITLAECLRLLFNTELNTAIEYFLTKVNKTIPELLTYTTEPNQKSSDLALLPEILRSGLNMEIIALAMKQKIKLCSNSTKGHQYNAFVAIGSASLPQNQLIKRFDYFWAYVQRNKKFKPTVDGLELIEMISLQLTNTIFYKHHTYPFPTLLFDKYLTSEGLVANWSYTTEGFFKHFVRALFRSADALIPKRILSLVSNFYQLPSSPQFQSKIIDLREAMHYFTTTFITPPIAKQIFETTEFSTFLYYIAIVGYLPTLYYLLYDCGFVPKFEHYHALVDAANNAQPFTTTHVEQNLAKLIEPFIDQNNPLINNGATDEKNIEKDEKGEKNNEKKSSIPDQLPKNLQTLSKLQRLLPKGCLNDDVVNAHENYKDLVAMTKENFALVDFPYQNTPGNASITRTIPDEQLIGKTSTIPSYVEQWTAPKLGLFHAQSLYNSNKYDIPEKELITLYQITPGQLLNTIITAYFQHPSTKDPVNQHSLITWLFVFIQNDPNFPESVIPLPSDIAPLEKNKGEKSEKGQKSSKKKDKSSTTTPKKEISVGDEYLDRLKTLPKAQRDFTHTSNSYNMIYRLVLGAGLIPFIDIFELCMFAQYNNYMYALQLELKKPTKDTFVPVPPTTRFNHIVDLFSRDYLPMHPGFYFRRTQVLNHLLHRLFYPLVELHIEDQTDVLAQNDITSPTTKGSEKQAKNGHKTGKGDVNKVVPKIDKKHLINDSAVLINFLALTVLQGYSASLLQPEGSGPTGFPYHLIANIFNYLPNVTMSPHFVHIFIPSLPTVQHSVYINAYDQYLGLYYQTNPDEIIEKYGYRSFLYSPSSVSSPTEHQNTTHLRYLSPLFHPSYNDKLQPLYYLQDQPIKTYISCLHLFMFHSIDINSLVDSHGNSFAHFVMNAATYQPQQQNDVTFFLQFVARLSSICKEIKTNQLLSFDPTTKSHSLPNPEDQSRIVTDIKKGKKGGNNKKGQKTPKNSSTPTPMTISTPGLPESHDEIVGTSHFHDIVENNLLFNWLKAQQLEFKTDSIGTPASTDTSPAQLNITFQEVLDAYPQLSSEFKELVDYLPSVENKFGVNTMMSAVGANNPLPSTFAQLPSSYPMLFQKDAYGRTLLHHFCGLTTINHTLNNDSDSTNTYSTITNARLQIPHPVHIEQDRILQQIIDPLTRSTVLPSNHNPTDKNGTKDISTLQATPPLPSHISYDNRLILLTRDHIVAPLQFQSTSIQQHFQKGGSFTTLNPSTQIPLSIADLISMKQSEDEDTSLYLEQIRLISLFTLQHRDVKFNLEDFTTQLAIEAATNETAIISCMEPNHPVYQDYPEQSFLFDTLGTLISSCSHLCGILNDNFQDLIDDPKQAKELLSKNIISDIQSMFSRQIDGSLPMFNPVEPDQ